MLHMYCHTRIYIYIYILYNRKFPEGVMFAYFGKLVSENKFSEIAYS